MFKSVLSIAAVIAATLAMPAQARVANADEVYLVKGDALILADARLDGALRMFTEAGYTMYHSEDWREVPRIDLTSGNGVYCEFRNIGNRNFPNLFRASCGIDNPSYATGLSNITIARSYNNAAEMLGDIANLRYTAVRLVEQAGWANRPSSNTVPSAKMGNGDSRIDNICEVGQKDC
jgi:hypothetical protein